MVSIPKRVSEALKPFHSQTCQAQHSFQSLKGFQRLWSHLLRSSKNRNYQFQSLKGFQRLWSKGGWYASSWSQKFQSLKGFQRLWSVGAGTAIELVSLFQSLKGFQRLWSQWICYPYNSWYMVSIPKRVSEALKPVEKLRSLFCWYGKMFQSLKGFQRLWSARLYLDFWQSLARFNP